MRNSQNLRGKNLLQENDLNKEEEFSFSETSSVTMLTNLDYNINNKYSTHNPNLTNRLEQKLNHLNTTVNNILSSEETKLKQESAEQFRRQKLARSVPIPTSDSEVKKKLRELGRPICLFGEKALDRRERLKKEVYEIVISLGEIPEILTKLTSKSEKENENLMNEVFYTEGGAELKKARMEVLKYSIPINAFKLEKEKKKFMELDRVKESQEYEEYLERSKNFEFISSQYADERGCSRGALSPDDKFYAVAGWSGICTVFDLPDLKKVTYLKGHSEKVNSVAFHPNFNSTKGGFPAKGPNMATGSCDNLIKIWSFLPDRENQFSINFEGHEDRVNQVVFHPIGDYLASTSHDKTWRLWDLETKKEILLQEGHNAAVYPMAFQNEGALAATGDLAGVGLLWDLRSGRNIMSLIGHVKQLLTIKFSPNSYQIVTGSDDNTMRVWDLRKRNCSHVIPAHNSLITDVCFEHTEGKFLLSASFDGTFKMWNNRDWSIVKTFSSTSEGKLTSVSITKDAKNVVTSSLDRTVKLWTLRQ
jgi:U4/U6 small nuclear ribonucleoprotein PRP4